MIDEWDHFLGFGYASTLPAEEKGDDVVQQLRDVVEEVTGKKLPSEPRRGMGFVYES